MMAKNEFFDAVDDHLADADEGHANDAHGPFMAIARDADRQAQGLGQRRVDEETHHAREAHGRRVACEPLKTTRRETHATCCGQRLVAHRDFSGQTQQNIDLVFQALQLMDQRGIRP